MEEKRYYASDFNDQPVTKMLLEKLYKDGVTLSELGDTNLVMTRLNAKALNRYWLSKALSEAEAKRVASSNVGEE